MRSHKIRGSGDENGEYLLKLAPNAHAQNNLTFLSVASREQHYRMMQDPVLNKYCTRPCTKSVTVFRLTKPGASYKETEKTVESLADRCVGKMALDLNVFIAIEDRRVVGLDNSLIELQPDRDKENERGESCQLVIGNR